MMLAGWRQSHARRRRRSGPGDGEVPGHDPAVLGMRNSGYIFIDAIISIR
jgi:hypothetical protein